MPEHTLEPWETSGHPADHIWSQEGKLIATTIEGPVDANAKRIAECVNACKGIPSEVLEREDGIHGVIADAMLRIKDRMRHGADTLSVPTGNLRQALKELGMETREIDALLNRRRREEGT